MLLGVFLHRWDYCWEYEFDADVKKKIEEYHHHDGEQLGFYKRGHIKRCRLSKKKDILGIARNEKFQFIYLAKTVNIKCHIQHEKSWLRWIIVEQVNYNFTSNTNFNLCFLKKGVPAHFQSFFRKSNRDAFWENEGKIH